MSMTREEKIKRLKALKARCERLIASSDRGPEEWRKDAEGLDLALTALRGPTREMVERMRGEWRPIHGLSEYYCSRCGEEFEIHAYDKDKYQFCPCCMAPMTDEAVDIRLKELEALKDD